MNLKLFWSNWKDRRAVKRAERQRKRQERADKTVFVARQPMSVVTMLNAAWLVTKIGVAVFGGWWVFTQMPGVSWATDKMLKGSVLGTIVDLGRSAKEKAGDASASAGDAASGAAKAIGEGLSSAWNSLPSLSGPQDPPRKPWQGDWGTQRPPPPPQKYAALPPAASDRHQAPTAQLPSSRALENERAAEAARREAVRAEVARREEAALKAEIERARQAGLAAARMNTLPPPPQFTQPQSKGFFTGPDWESKTPAERTDFHWRGRSIRSATPGWAIAPCGDRKGDMWVHVPKGTQEGPSNCPFYETRYFASELPSPENAKRDYLAIDEGWYWRRVRTGQGTRWALTKTPTWKGQEAVRSVDLTPDQQRERWGLRG